MRWLFRHRLFPSLGRSFVRSPNRNRKSIKFRPCFSFSSSSSSSSSYVATSPLLHSAAAAAVSVVETSATTAVSAAAISAAAIRSLSHQPLAIHPESAASENLSPLPPSEGNSSIIPWFCRFCSFWEGECFSRVCSQTMVVWKTVLPNYHGLCYWLFTNHGSLENSTTKLLPVREQGGSLT